MIFFQINGDRHGSVPPHKKMVLEEKVPFPNFQKFAISGA